MRDPLEESAYFKLRGKRLFWFTVFSFLLFVVTYAASIFKQYFGFNMHWAGDNFVFNIGFFIPATLLSVIISYFTLGLTLIYWKKFPNKKQKIWTVILTLPIISLFFYMIFIFFMANTV